MTSAQPEERAPLRTCVPQGTLPDIPPRHLLETRVTDPVGSDFALVHALVQPILVRDVLGIREPGR